MRLEPNALSGGAGTRSSKEVRKVVPSGGLSPSLPLDDHGKKYFTQNQLKKVVQEAVQSSKEIDQKTIKEMLHEITELNSKIRSQDLQLKQYEQQLEKVQEQQKSTPSSVYHSPTKRPNHTNDINMVYSFLLGSIMMLLVSTLLPWLFNTLKNIDFYHLFRHQTDEDTDY